MATQYAPAPVLPVGALAPRAPPSRRNVRVSLEMPLYCPTPNTFLRPPLHLPHALRPRWVKRPGDLDLWPFDLESGVRVTCDVGYLCANSGLPRPVCSRLRPDVRDRQTETSDRRQTVVVRQKHHWIKCNFIICLTIFKYGYGCKTVNFKDRVEVKCRRGDNFNEIDYNSLDVQLFTIIAYSARLWT